MKQEIDIANWNRKEHYQFFTQFEEPFFGATIQVDCTHAYAAAKAQQRSFFLYYLYQTLKTVNRIEAFRYRIADGKVFLYDQVHASPTIDRPDGTFGFAYIDYDPDAEKFFAAAERVAEEVRQSNGLVPAMSGENVIHFSALPWLDFTSLSHARCFHFPDSSPKISVGKMTERDGRKSMPVSIHVHHALADGRDMGLFAEVFQQLMNGEQL